MLGHYEPIHLARDDSLHHLDSAAEYMEGTQGMTHNKPTITDEEAGLGTEYCPCCLASLTHGNPASGRIAVGGPCMRCGWDPRWQELFKRLAAIEAKLGIENRRPESMLDNPVEKAFHEGASAIIADLQQRAKEQKE